MKPMKPVAILIPLTMVFALVSCRDDRPSHAAQSPTVRIALLSPAFAVILRDLDRDDVIVARHGFDEVLPKSIPVCGDQTGIDYEALLRTNPTHVLLERSAAGIPNRLQELARERMWELIDLPMLSLDDIVSAISALDCVSRGVEQSAPLSEAGSQLLIRAERAWSERPGFQARAGRILAVAWTDPIGVMGPGSFHHQLVARLGGVPVPTTGSAYISLSAEDVARLDPDAIVLFMPGADESHLNELLGPLARVDLRAVKAGRVVLITHPLAHSPSSALIEVADQFTERVNSWHVLSNQPSSASLP